jgi:8-oxo-dGTP diphosphatase
VPGLDVPLITVVAAVLMEPDGKILLAQRPLHKAHGGLWEFPGGKLDAGESPEEALCRELEEELGLVVSPKALKPLTFASHRYETFHLLMPLYLCCDWEGEPQPREGQVIAWVDVRDLGAYPMPPADEPLIPILQALQ